MKKTMKQRIGIVVFAMIFILSQAVTATVAFAARAEITPLKETTRPPMATPSLNENRRSAERDGLPDNIKTMEDYRNPYETGGRAQPYKVSVWRVMGSLAIVVILIVGLVYAFRVLWAKGMRFDLKGHHIKVLDIVQLGMNRALFLVSVGGKVVLLGSSDKGLAYLMEIGDRSLLDEAPGSLTRSGGVSFQGEFESAVTEKSGYPPAEETSGGEGASPFMDKLKSKLNKLEEDGRE
ncbi:MAG TPA: flagellar biosynthetic protein FliO [bacterium]|nr:flagellar biosynthetic protein FliO [bacterium]